MQKKQTRVRLQLAASTLRHLSALELTPVVGGSVPALSDTRGVCTTRPIGF